MPKLTLEQISPGEAERLGTIYRNLAHFGFKKSMLSFSDVHVLWNCLGVHISAGENLHLYPSEYITVMQAFYDLYRWGKYDDEEECVWLLNKIKSEAWHRIRNQYYGRLNYFMLLELIKIHGPKCGLRINVNTL